MNKEIIERKLKAEIELFKIYSLFIIGLITGISSLLLKDKFYDNNIVLILLIIGFVFLIAVTIIFIKYLHQIKILTKT